jgi:uncharacterized protein involved in exopolysaccharide biosynthesis
MLNNSDLSTLHSDDDVNVVEYVEAIWRRRRTVALLVFAGTLIGALLASMAPRVYVAQVSLGVTKGPGAPDATAVSNMIALIANPSSAFRIVNELHLDQATPPLSAQDLFSRAVTVERDGTVIVITGRLRDPVLASKVVQRVAEVGIETVRRFGASEQGKLLETLKSQMEAAKTQLDQANAHRRVSRNTAELEVQRALLSAAEQQLKAAGNDAALSGNQKARDAYVERLARFIAESRTTIATLERNGYDLHGTRIDEARSPRPVDPATDRAAQATEADAEHNVALGIYTELAGNYERAMIRASTDASQLQFIAGEQTPASPVSRHVARTAAVGGAIGLIIGSLVALVIPAFQRRSVTA